MSCLKSLITPLIVSADNTHIALVNDCISWIENEDFQVGDLRARAMRLDLLSDIRSALETALQGGQTLKQFTAALQPTLQALGWWGKQVIVNSQGVGELAGRKGMGTQTVAAVEERRLRSAAKPS